MTDHKPTAIQQETSALIEEYERMPSDDDPDPMDEQLNASGAAHADRIYRLVRSPSATLYDVAAKLDLVESLLKESDPAYDPKEHALDGAIVELVRDAAADLRRWAAKPAA